MKKNNIELTQVDTVILHSYSDMVDGLSTYLGDGYEVVLHSLENLEHSAIKVINGFHTGRTIGAPITDMALAMLDKISSSHSYDKGITYFTTNPKGEPLKSTTIPVKGENNRIIGLLCINFYMNTSVTEFFRNFTNENLTSDIVLSPLTSQESFVSNNLELIKTSVLQIQTEIQNDNSITTSNKNKEIIRRLANIGIFSIKDSVPLISQLLNISKNTVYLHLRNINNH